MEIAQIPRGGTGVPPVGRVLTTSGAKRSSIPKRKTTAKSRRQAAKTHAKAKKAQQEQTSVFLPLLFVNKSDSPPVNFSQQCVQLGGRDHFIRQLVVELLVSEIPTALSDAQEFARSIVGLI
jgi:hypothetical protein